MRLTVHVELSNMYDIIKWIECFVNVPCKSMQYFEDFNSFTSVTFCLFNTNALQFLPIFGNIVGKVTFLPIYLLNLFFIIVWLVSDMGNKVLLIFDIIKVFAISIIINNDYSWLRAVFLTILHNCQLNNWNSKFKVHMQCLFDVFPGEVGTAGIETNCVFGFWV